MYLYCDQTDVVCDLSKKTGGVICLLFEASATASLSHPGCKRWRNLYAASLNLSSLLYLLFWLIWMGPFHVFLSFLGMLYFLLQITAFSTLHQWWSTLPLTFPIHQNPSLTRRFEAHCSSKGGEAGTGKEIKLPLIYSLSVSFSFPRSGSFPSSCLVLIIDGLSSAAELETEAIDWPRNRHGFLLKVVKNLPWLMAKQFLEASWRGGGMKQWVACTNNWY